MAPLDLLLSIRRVGLPDDAARVLFAVASGVCRYGAIQNATDLGERQVWRMLAVLRARGAIRVHLAPSAGIGNGSGKLSIYSITAEGIALVRSIFEQHPPGHAARRPPGAPLPLRLNAADGFSFLA
jgi:hypothetical protein